MTETPTARREHPLAAAVARIRAELSAAVGLPARSMSAPEVGDLVVELTQAGAQLTALQL